MMRLMLPLEEESSIWMMLLIILDSSIYLRMLVESALMPIYLQNDLPVERRGRVISNADRG
jgi:hypothetical protein